MRHSGCFQFSKNLRLVSGEIIKLLKSLSIRSIFATTFIAQAFELQTRRDLIALMAVGSISALF